MLECPQSKDEDDCRHLNPELRSQGRSCQIKDAREEENGEVQSWEVVMQEELSLHDEEWDVVHDPAEEEEATKAVVELHGGWRRHQYRISPDNDRLLWERKVTYCCAGPCSLSSLEE